MENKMNRKTVKAALCLLAAGAVGTIASLVTGNEADVPYKGRSGSKSVAYPSDGISYKVIEIIPSDPNRKPFGRSVWTGSMMESVEEDFDASKYDFGQYALEEVKACNDFVYRFSALPGLPYGKGCVKCVIVEYEDAEPPPTPGGNRWDGGTKECYNNLKTN